MESALAAHTHAGDGTLATPSPMHRRRVLATAAGPVRLARPQTPRDGWLRSRLHPDLVGWRVLDLNALGGDAVERCAWFVCGGVGSVGGSWAVPNYRMHRSRAATLMIFFTRP